MPNWMSDEDLGLSDGDLWQCDHCGKVMSVDDSFHSCPEGAEASREATDIFTEKFFGDGTIKARQFIVTVVAPDTEVGFDHAWNDMSSWGPQDKEGSDDVLKFAWTIEEIK